MRSIESTDPYLAAAGELVRDLEHARAERDGLVTRPDAGIYAVSDDGAFEYVGPSDAVFNAVADTAIEVYENEMMFESEPLRP